MPTIAESRVQTPQQRILSLAFTEFHELVAAVFVDGALGRPAPAMAIRLNANHGAISIVVLDDLSGLQLAQLNELCGQNLEIRHRGGELIIACPSLERPANETR